MRKIALIYLLSISSILFRCNDEENIILNPKESFSFEGTLKTINSDENLFEDVTLKISNGHYESTTSLAYGYGAGRVEVQNGKINFIDTLFVAVPAIFGPSYVLSGEHHYEFDGDNLAIWKKKNIGSISYQLKLIE